MDLEEISRDYFNNLNPIAKRIAKDVEQVRNLYQDIWHSLNSEEQDIVIDNSIIKPEAVSKYSHITPNEICGHTDNDFVHSWFTRSQMDLYSQTIEPKMKQFVDKTTLLKKIHTEEHSKKIEKNIQYSKTPFHIQGETSTEFTKSPTFSNVSSNDMLFNNENVNSTSSSNIPRTGFDFLDNW